jgi:hypothetical protein
MALFSIRNERDLVVFNGIASETTAATFVASASAGEGQILNQFGAAITGKEKFCFYVKHLDGRVRKSDVIDPDKLTYYKKQAPVSEVLPSAVVTVGTATAGDLYEIVIRIWNDGSLSRDNVIFLNGSYQAVSGDTTTTIATALAAAVSASQTRMGQSYFTITPSTNTITFQSIKLPFVTGKKDGRAIDFNIQARQVNPSTLALTDVTVAYTEYVPNPCSVNYIKDLEYQTHGAFADSLRGLAYPYDFALFSDVVDLTVYTLYEFGFYDGDEFNHAVQKSPRQLTVAVPAANVAAFDAAIAKVRQVIDLTTAATNNQVLTWTDAAGDYHPA